MIWHIAKKEIYHNLMTLRFVLMIILLPILMIANALIYGFGDNGYTAEIRDYNRKVDQGRSHIEKYAAQGLGELAMTGPAEIPKRPTQLKFCADGADALIPHSITIAERINWERPEYEGLVENYSWRELWSLEYLPSNHGGDATTLIKIDWVFIGIFMSFFVILFTFDAITGERVRGTLSLMMSNPIPRGQVLFAKYLGTFFTLIIPLLIGVLMNLLIIYLSGNIPFDSGSWLRILGMIGLFALHISIFIFLGLFFSSRVSNAITSLVWLLLTWVCLAFIFPSLLGLFVGTLDPIPSIERISAEKRLQIANIDDEFRPAELVKAAKLSEAPSVDNPSATRRWATYFRERSEVQTRMADARVDQQLRQVQLTRELTQISPTVCFQYAMEGLANTGIASYMSFVKQVRRYRNTFIDFIKSEDRGDPDSLHIYPVREGLSQKPVNPDVVPRFKERISHQSIIFPLGLLILFNILFFIAAQLSFLKCDLK
ncbi:MAG: ABC transporter permease subunit [Candidatus Poribacteria bacterium]|nr:ABC transporter permease subunit [Candidatus Poribacteria bacterium]